VPLFFPPRPSTSSFLPPFSLPPILPTRPHLTFPSPSSSFRILPHVHPFSSLLPCKKTSHSNQEVINTYLPILFLVSFSYFPTYSPQPLSLISPVVFLSTVTAPPPHSIVVLATLPLHRPCLLPLPPYLTHKPTAIFPPPLQILHPLPLLIPLPLPSFLCIAVFPLPSLISLLFSSSPNSVPLSPLFLFPLSPFIRLFFDSTPHFSPPPLAPPLSTPAHPPPTLCRNCFFHLPPTHPLATPPLLSTPPSPHLPLFFHLLLLIALLSSPLPLPSFSHPPLSLPFFIIFVFPLPILPLSSLPYLTPFLLLCLSPSFPLPPPPLVSIISNSHSPLCSLFLYLNYFVISLHRLLPPAPPPHSSMFIKLSSPADPSPFILLRCPSLYPAPSPLFLPRSSL